MTKRLYLVFMLYLLMLILAGCGEDSPEAITTTPAPPTITPLPPTTLTIGYADARLQTSLETLQTRFEAQHPAVTLILTQQDPTTFRETLIREINLGMGPDVILGSSEVYRALLEEGLLLPLTDPIIADAITYTPIQAFVALTVNEIPYGFPARLDVPLIYRNIALVAEEVTSFEDFLAAAQTSGAIIPPDFSLTAGWLKIENFNRPVAPEGTLDITVPTLTAYLERLTQLQAVAGVTFTTESAAFEAGEVGLYVGSSAEIARLKAALGDDLAIAPVAVSSVDTSYRLADVTVMMISLNAVNENIGAGQAWMAFLAHPDQQDFLSQSTGLPPMRYTLTPNPLLQQAANYAEDAWIIPYTNPFYETTLPRYNTAFAQVLSGVLTPAEAAQAVLSVQ